MHAALAPAIVVADVKPNLVLVAVVLVTAVAGFTPGITWAFVAGLTANLLVGDPLGSVPFTMLLVAALVAGGARLFGRLAWVYPVVAAFAGSLVADIALLLVGQVVSGASIKVLPLDLLMAAAILNALLAALLLFPARAVAARYVPDEAGAW